MIWKKKMKAKIIKMEFYSNIKILKIKFKLITLNNIWQIINIKRMKKINIKQFLQNLTKMNKNRFSKILII